MSPSTLSARHCANTSSTMIASARQNESAAARSRVWGRWSVSDGRTVRAQIAYRPDQGGRLTTAHPAAGSQSISASPAVLKLKQCFREPHSSYRPLQCRSLPGAKLSFVQSQHRRRIPLLLLFSLLSTSTGPRVLYLRQFRRLFPGLSDSDHLCPSNDVSWGIVVERMSCAYIDWDGRRTRVKRTLVTHE